MGINIGPQRLVTDAVATGSLTGGADCGTGVRVHIAVNLPFVVILKHAAGIYGWDEICHRGGHGLSGAATNVTLVPDLWVVAAPRDVVWLWRWGEGVGDVPMIGKVRLDRVFQGRRLLRLGRKVSLILRPNQNTHSPTRPPP